MQFKSKLEAGEFVVLAEIEPPKGVDFNFIEEAAESVKDKVDAFLVTEMNNAIMKMSAMGGAIILQSKGLETIMQVNCRDRNRLAIQADLLAAHACGIRNLVAVKSEPTTFGDHHQAKAVNDISLIELMHVIRELQEGHDMAGVELSGSPDFFIGSNIKATAVDQELEDEIEAMGDKLDAGNQFLITPPVFDLASFEAFLKQVDLQETKIIPTVLLLKSAGMARYISRNIEHIAITDDMVRRIQKAKKKPAECLLIAKEMIGTLKASEAKSKTAEKNRSSL